MSFHAQTALTEVSEAPAVLLLPGGFGSLEMASDPALVEHLRELVTPEVVCLAVSTGSLPLAATGLLNGHEVAGHWLSRRLLRRFGAIPVDDPLAVSDRLVTASGSVSAGEAAKIAADITSYAPPPPDRRGSFHLRQGP
jgi:cyclohexyl-isocyanide hydratase